ncbi:AAA family ATPase [Rhizobium sp. LEGMi198b]
MTFKLRGTGTGKPQLVGITAGELLKKDFAPREFAIDPWLRTGETALIWAATGVGKTWLTLSLAVAMAGGGRVWEWKAPKPRKVLVVDGEMNLQDLQGRLKTLVDTGAVTGLDRVALGENLKFVARQAQDPDSEFFDITDPLSQQHVLQAMDDTGSEVVIIDNVTTCADGLRDENDSVAFRPVMSFLMRMKQAGKVAILVHHANKSGQDFRGSTALEATFEVKLGLHPAGASVGKASFIAKFGKFRAQGDSTIQPRQWTLELSGWTVDDDESEGAGNDVLKALKSCKFVTAVEIGDHIGRDKHYVGRQLRLLVAQGQLREEDKDRYFKAAKRLRSSPFDDETFEVDDGDLTGTEVAPLH